jgi:hypothetical protein
MSIPRGGLSALLFCLLGPEEGDWTGAPAAGAEERAEARHIRMCVGRGGRGAVE